MLSIEFITTLLVTLLTVIILTLIGDHFLPFLPFGEGYLILYILFLFSVTIWLGWMLIQNILKQNKPLSYDFEKNVYLRYAKKIYLFTIVSTNSEDDEENSLKSAEIIDNLMNEQRSIDDRIADFTKDVEKYFMVKWYSNISKDETFLNETRNLLDEIVRRFLQIVVQVDNKKLVHGILIIFLKHIKEFRKTIKRQQNNSKSIEDLYRCAHIASKNDKAFEHFMCQITTKVFRQLLSWELYNSVPCKCLVSILAKKLSTYIVIYVSTPHTINYKIAQLCLSADRKKELAFDNYQGINLIDIDIMQKKEKDKINVLERNTLENKLIDAGNTPKVSPKKVDVKNGNLKKVTAAKDVIVKAVDEKLIEDYGKDELDGEIEQESIKIDASHAVSAPVKIHKPQSSKTWRNSSDLECISLGQDLLVLQEFNDPDLQIQNLIDRKPWKDNSDSLEVDEKHHPIWNITENIEEILESKELNIPSPNIPSFISNTIKPIGNVTASTLHNMKEFQQSTVNNIVNPVSQATSTAMHKIGDFQDEAAGVMEGIFDFGMAGIRKGLRLTGLQDNISEKTKLDFSKMSKPFEIPPSHASSKHKINKLAKVPRVMSEDVKTVSQEENVWINPLIKDSPNFDGQILLQKSPVAAAGVPTISTESTISPDPEYEDVTDLATTTAKLRSLLQQKTSESALNTPAVSPMLLDDQNKPFSSPLEYTGSSVEDIEVDGALPSLYKFCARTATGVFQNTLNTLKTALPGNISDQEHNRQESAMDRYWDSENWMYVASDAGVDDFCSRAQRLLNERRTFCTVDNAYEAVESLDVLDQVEADWNIPIPSYDDELDDLEMHIPFTKALVDIFCELASESDTFLVKESVVKIMLILFGELTEEYICNASSKITRISSFIGKLPNEPKKDILGLSLNELASFCLDKFPSYAKTIIGENTLISVAKVLLSSLQSQKINQDISLQLFELFASLLVEASNKMTPAYSA